MHDITPAVSGDDGFVKIDIHKAFTHAASQIKCVPVLNVFDAFQKKDNHPIKDLNLYKVKPLDDNTSIFLNKSINLCYGMFLHPILKKMWSLGV